MLGSIKKDDHEHNDLIQSNFLATPETLAQRGLTFNRGDVENYQQMLRDFQPSTLTLPMPSIKNYYDLWLDPMVMDLVSAYMGFVPELTEAYVRRNFPFNYRVMNHYWHRDSNHSKHLLKAFVFFTDCDIKTGAHHYIAGSVHDERFRDKTYYSDEEINDVWPIGSENHMISTVLAGTIIIEDTRGLHKAGTSSNHIVILAMLYSCLLTILKNHPVCSPLKTVLLIPLAMTRNASFRQKTLGSRINV